MPTTETAQTQLKWEYLQINRKTEEYLVNDLNKLGQSGWEMISVSFEKSTKSGLGADSSWIAFLKRPCTGEVAKRPAGEKAAGAPATSAKEAAAGEDDSEIFDFAD